MKIYWYDNSKNIIGANLKKIRLSKKLTQNDLAAKLQLQGYEFDRITILRIENGLRFVPDYEVKILCETLNVTYDALLGKMIDWNTRSIIIAKYLIVWHLTGTYEPVSKSILIGNSPCVTNLHKYFFLPWHCLTNIV